MAYCEILLGFRSSQQQIAGKLGRFALAERRERRCICAVGDRLFEDSRALKGKEEIIFRGV